MLLPLAVAVVLIAGLVIGFLPAIISSQLRGWIASSVETSLEVELDASAIAWGGEQSLEGLRLKERRPDGSFRTVLSVRRAVIKNSLLDIVRSGSAPLAIEIDEPVVEVHRDASGSLNWARLLDAEGGGGDAPGTESRPFSRERQPSSNDELAGRSDPVSWNIERELNVTVRNGRVLYRDDVLSTTSVLRFTVETRDGKLASEIDLDSGFLSLLGPRLPEGLELGENVHASITELVVDAGLEKGRGLVELTGRMRYEGYRVSRIAANVETNERQLLFRDVNADLNGGRLIAPRLSLDLTGEKPGYELELGLEAVEANHDMSPLLAYVVPFLSLEDRQGALSGKITASLKLQGHGLEVADLETLEGSGKLRLRDGQFQGSRFFREVARLVGTDLDRVAFSELGSDFRISAGAVASDDVFLTETSDKLRNLGLKGTTSLRGEIDYGVDLAALQETVGDRGIRDVLRGVSTVLGDDGVPIRLGGTLKAPRLTWGASPKQKGKAEKGAGGLLDRIFGQ